MRLPLSLDLRAKRVVVIGGGAVAERKIATLRECGAAIEVIAPEVTESIAAWAAAGELTWQPLPYTPGNLLAGMLVIAATDDDAVNEAVAEEAGTLGIWCNVASPPEAGSCHLLAGLERGGLTIAIGTDGASPYAARRVRELIEAAVPPAVGELVELIGEFRDEVKARYDSASRRGVYQRMWDSGALAHLEAGERAAARDVLSQIVHHG